MLRASSRRILLACGVCLVLLPATLQSQAPSTAPAGERLRQLEAELQARRAKLLELEALQARLKAEMEAALAQARLIEQQIQTEKDRVAAPRPGAGSVEERLERLERVVLALERELRGGRVEQSREAKVPAFTALDFQALANQKRAEIFHSSQFPGNSLAPLAAGEQRLLGVPFRIGEGILQLGSTELADKPEKIAGIKVGHKFAKLHLLHACAYFLEDEVPIGSYTINYADGTTETIPIINNKDVTDWWKYPFSKEPTQGKVAWTGDNGAGKEFEATQWLFLSTWLNPKPDTAVTSIDFTSTMNTRCAPFCVAITAEQP